MRMIKAMRIGKNLQQGYEGASFEFTVYIIMKVSGRDLPFMFGIIGRCFPNLEHKA